MSKSSINFQTAKGNSSSHMSRNSFVSYLIEHDNNHYEYKHYQDPKEYLEFAQIQTKLLTKRSMQSSAIQNFTQEAVLNIKKDTTIEEVVSLFKTFNKNFKGGFKVFEIALHKDEGVFIQSKYNIDDLVFDSKTLKIYKDGIDVSDEVIAFAPNKDIFYNKDTKKWYKEKDFKTEIDTSKLQKKMNYHAHISFTKWDELTGKNIRLQKSDLQNIQTITAKSLDMQRGQENSQFKRLNHYQIKKIQSEINDKKITENELKQEVAKLRAELKENGATRADYAKLEALNRKLQEQIKSKDLTVVQLHERIKVLASTVENKDNKIQELQQLAYYTKEDGTKKSYKAYAIEYKAKADKQASMYLGLSEEKKIEVQQLSKEITTLKTQISTLEAQNESLGVKVHELEDKSTPRPNMNEYEHKYKNLLNEIKELNIDLEAKQTTTKGIFAWIKSQFTEFKQVISNLKKEVSSLKELIKSKENNTLTIDQIFEIEIITTGKSKDELVKKAQKAQEPKESKSQKVLEID